MKRNHKNPLSLALIAVLIVGALGGCSSQGGGSGDAQEGNTGNSAAAGEAVTLRWADHWPSSSLTAAAIDEFCAQVKEATEGRVVIEAYHDAVLGASVDALAMLSSGTADIIWTSTAIFNGQFPYSEMLTLPLGILDAPTGTEIMWDLLEQYPQAFEEEYADYHLLMAHVTTTNVIGSTKGSIQSLSDLAGLNIRAGAGVPTDMATMWGGTPVAIATPDLYTSLQRGVVDAYIFDVPGINTFNLGELTPCLVDAGLGFNACPVLMSPDAWVSISESDQQIISGLAGRTGSLALANTMQEEADTFYGSYEASGAELYLLQPGDALYEELHAPFADYIDGWVTEMTTDTVDVQAMVDYVYNYTE